MPAGLAAGFWVSEVAKNKASIEDVASNLILSDEFIEEYGANLDNGEFVDALYMNILDRAGDESGRAFWMGELASGLARSDVLLEFANSTEYSDTEIDITGSDNTPDDGLMG